MSETWTSSQFHFAKSFISGITFPAIAAGAAPESSPHVSDIIVDLKINGTHQETFPTYTNGMVASSLSQKFYTSPKKILPRGVRNSK